MLLRNDSVVPEISRINDRLSSLAPLALTALMASPGGEAVMKIRSSERIFMTDEERRYVSNLYAAR